MILTADYHTHTPYSHGKNTVAENAAAAAEKGLKQIGIADHGFSHVAFGLRRRQVSAYKAECEAASKQYGLDVLVGIEANIRGVDGKADLTEKDFENFDVYLCGKHIFIWYDCFSDMIRYGGGNLNAEKKKKNPPKKLLDLNTKAYINVIKNNPVDVITHLNFCCFADAVEVAKAAADYGTYLELNSKKTHLSDEELYAILNTGVNFVINSDAHTPDRVGEISLVEKLLERVPIPEERIMNVNGKIPQMRFKSYKEKA